jgi:capsular polysaccharide biosynthesis protein
MNENKNNYQIDAVQVLSLLLKRWWLIVIAAVVCAASMFGYTKLFVRPTYSANATLIIDGGAAFNYTQILAGQYQSADYPYILKANVTLERVADKLNASSFEKNGGKPYREYTARNLSGMISGETVEGSRIFVITVVSENPEEAALIANTIVDVLPDRVEEIIKGEDLVNVVDYATVPLAPSSPNQVANTAIGFALGAIIGIIASLVLGFSNDTLDSENWLITTFKDDIPLLTVVPDSSSRSYRRDKYGRYKYKYSQSYTSSAIKSKK